MEQVPCKLCKRDIPKARAELAISNGCCKTCNLPNLSSSKTQDRPVYETEAWSKGEKL